MYGRREWAAGPGRGLREGNDGGEWGRVTGITRNVIKILTVITGSICKEFRLLPPIKEEFNNSRASLRVVFPVRSIYY